MTILLNGNNKMPYTESTANNAYRGIFVTLDRATKLTLAKDTHPIVPGPRVFNCNRKRLAGHLTAFIKRNVSTVKDVTATVVPVQYGTTVNKLIPSLRQLDPEVRYAREAVVEHIYRHASSSQMAGMLVDMVDSLGPDFLQVYLGFKAPNDLKYHYTYEYNMRAMMEIQRYAKPNEDLMDFWMPFHSSYDDYVKAVGRGDHDDFLKLSV